MSAPNIFNDPDFEEVLGFGLAYAGPVFLITSVAAFAGTSLLKKPHLFSVSWVILFLVGHLVLAFGMAINPVLPRNQAAIETETPKIPPAKAEPKRSGSPRVGSTATRYNCTSEHSLPNGGVYRRTAFLYPDECAELNGHLEK